jgi:hypothetical protein
MKSKFFESLTGTDTVVGGEQSQRMSELELLSKSGFMSVVGLSHFTLGVTKEPYSLP